MFIETILMIAALGAADNALVRQVVCAEVGFSRAAEARDLDAFLGFVDPDARFITNRVARGRDGVAEAWSAVFAADGPRMRWRPAVVEVSADGRLAISRGPYRSIREGDDGEMIESWGTYISTWRLGDDGRWRVLFDTGGDAGKAPTDADIEILQSEPACP